MYYLSLSGFFANTGAPDFLLRLIIEKTQDKSTIWQHIVRITDPDVAAHMVLRHLSAWPLDVCLELLGMCRDRVLPSAPTAEEVERQYRQLSALRDVLEVDIAHLATNAQTSPFVRLKEQQAGGAPGKILRKHAESNLLQ